MLTQKLLTNLKFPALEGLYYMAPICSFWMSGLATVYPYPYLYPLPLPLPLPLPRTRTRTRTRTRAPTQRFGLATLVEMPSAFREGKFSLVGEHAQLFALSFILGFLVNGASFLVIKRTSSVLLELSNP